MGPLAMLGAGGVVAAICAGSLGCHDEHWLTYPWDDRRVLCSQAIDDLTLDMPWDLIEDQMLDATQTNAVLLVHAHTPGKTISLGAIERVLTLAERRGLSFVTARELGPDQPPRAGLAFGFDDNAIDEWFGIRDLLAAHHAHVTFFVTRWHSRSDAERAELRVLAGDGHDIEPHSTNHLHAPRYAAEHGVDGYVTDEVLPSIQCLVDAGYPPPAVYAYPFGQHTAALDAAILKLVPRVRLSTGECPY